MLNYFHKKYPTQSADVLNAMNLRSFFSKIKVDGRFKKNDAIQITHAESYFISGRFDLLGCG